MEDQQNKLAHDFYEFLAKELSKTSSQIEISIADRNWLWATTAVCGSRSCTVTTQDTWYQVTFDIDSRGQATGETINITEAVSALTDWLDNLCLSEMYLKHKFVDRKKIFLKKFWKETIKGYPELDRCTAMRLDQESYYYYYLWVIAKDRSCRIYLSGTTQLPCCEFYWDESQLLTLRTESTTSLSLILKRWLCDYAMPSHLEQEFPSLRIDELAKYYEEGRGIEGEFILSWDWIEQMYKGVLKTDKTPEILKLIGQMRERGYDKTLRAGQSMYTFIVSRSRRLGLKRDQPAIGFDFRDDAMDLYIKINDKEKLSCPKIEYTQQIDVLMKLLETKEID